MNSYFTFCCLAVVIKTTSGAECGSVVAIAEKKECAETMGDCLRKMYGRGAGRVPDKKPCGPGERDDGVSCWLDSYGRGAGRMPEKTSCPSGLRDDGTSCWSDAHIYGKGCCCTIWGCCGGCKSGYHDDGCTCRKTDVGIKLTLFERQTCKGNEDKFGALCYPKCREGYNAAGCCLCQPNGGARIVKTLGQRQYCRSDEDLHVGLCYSKCKEGFNPWGCCLCRPFRYFCPEGTGIINGTCVKMCTG